MSEPDDPSGYDQAPYDRSPYDKASDDHALPRIRYAEDDTDIESKDTSLLPTSIITARGPQVPAIVFVGGRRSVGRIERLEGTRVTIGRAIGNDIQILEDGVSRRHAELLVLAGGRAMIRDLGSSNGIHFRGQRVEQQLLQEGDRVNLGDSALLFASMDKVDEGEQVRLVDPVTRLPTRGRFVDAVDTDLRYAIECGEPLSVCLLGVDQLLDIHDHFGSRELDRLMREVAAIARNLVGSQEVYLARCAEEQLGLCLPDTGLKESTTCAESIRRAVQNAQLSPLDSDLPLTLSAGVACHPDTVQAQIGTVLVEQARRSLCRAIAAGRNRVAPSIS